jgi:hypothetical protein
MTNNDVIVHAFSWGFGPIRWAFSPEAAELGRQEVLAYCKQWGGDSSTVSPLYNLPLSCIGEGWEADYITL